MNISENKSSIDWQVAYDECLPSIRWMCSKILGSDHNFFEDAISETFEKAIKKEHTYDETKASLKTWMCAIAKNVCLQILKKEKMQAPLLIDVEDEVEEENEEEKLLYLKMNKIISSLNDDILKETFDMVVSGMSNADIAEKMNIKEVSVRGRIKRFLDKVRKQIHFDVPKKTGKNFGRLNQKNKVKRKFDTIEKGIYKKGSKYIVYSRLITGKSGYVGSFDSLEEAKQTKITHDESIKIKRAIQRNDVNQE